MKDKANAFEVGRTYVIKVTMDCNESDYVLSVRVLRRTPKTVTVIGDTAYTAEAKTCRPRIDPWTGSEMIAPWGIGVCADEIVEAYAAR